MADAAYDTLARVYEWLVPDALLAPAGAAEAFAAVTGALPAGARVLDCAAGTGQLAVGLALRGFAVTATDASPAMVARTRALAARHGVAVAADACAWEELAARDWDGPFEAVFCVGNSLTHAAGPAGRGAALAAMAGVLAPHGLLALTSRNWELVRAAGPGLRVADRLVERDGRAGLVIHGWTLAEDWDAAHRLDVAVALPAADGTVETHAERLTFWPFTHTALDADLRAAGLAPASSTYAAHAERYLVTARRSADGAGAG